MVSGNPGHTALTTTASSSLDAGRTALAATGTGTGSSVANPVLHDRAASSEQHAGAPSGSDTDRRNNDAHRREEGATRRKTDADRRDRDAERRKTDAHRCKTDADRGKECPSRTAPRRRRLPSRPIPAAPNGAGRFALAHQRPTAPCGPGRASGR
ncbi:MAG TPA: hypothetical protein VHT30_08555 [Acidimicrobiales bacterium]|nr:hypothetical protein [Acidimicrobiales bacterium]